MLGQLADVTLNFELYVPHVWRANLAQHNDDLLRIAATKSEVDAQRKCSDLLRLAFRSGIPCGKLANRRPVELLAAVSEQREGSDRAGD